MSLLLFEIVIICPVVCYSIGEIIKSLASLCLAVLNHFFELTFVCNYCVHEIRRAEASMRFKIVHIILSMVGLRKYHQYSALPTSVLYISLDLVMSPLRRHYIRLLYGQKGGFSALAP